MVFNAYASYYDLLYQNKEYAAEAEYVSSLLSRFHPRVKRILELGCGTGAHAEHLARMGYTVHGVDFSEQMLARADARRANLPEEVAERMSFSTGDIRSVRIDGTYDAVISLFHVMSYQTSNADLMAAHETAASHLPSGGIFIFDFWYGPAVLTQRPEVRVRRLENTTTKVTRIAEPAIHVNDNVVDVNYTMFVEQRATGEVSQLNELHRMRYLFLPELAQLRSAAFKELATLNWLTDASLDERSWAGLQVLGRI